MALKQRAQAEAVLAPKVRGTLRLAELIDEPLDFFAVCSSLNAFGGPGQVDYCAANAFLDAFAQAHPARRVVSINWCAWRDAGMAAETAAELPESLRRERAAGLRLGITSAEGREIFVRVLGSGLPQVLVTVRGVEAEREFLYNLPPAANPATAPASESRPGTGAYERPEGIGVAVAPASGAETTLARIWSELLGIREVGAEDDFYALGGHSLKAIQVLGEIRRRLEVEVTLQEMFVKPTVRALVRVIEGKRRREYKPIPRVPDRPSYPVSSAQKRLHAIQHSDSTGVGYNATTAYCIHGEFAPERLRDAMRALMATHANLRTIYRWEDGELRQCLVDATEPALEIEDAAGWELARALEDFVRPFDLAKQCPIRMRLRKLGERDWVLQLDLHHIAIDEGCTQRLLDDLLRAYAGEPLRPETLRYVDYAVWLTEGAGAAERAGHQKYWNEVYGEPLPTLELPLDYPRPPQRSYRGECLRFRIGSDHARALRELGRAHDASLQMVLLSLWQVLLAQLGGVDDLAVGVPVSGRDRPELQDLGGMFLNTLPIRARPAPAKPFRQLLVETRAAMLAGLDHQDFALDELIGRPGLSSAPGHHPIFDTLFNYLEDAPRVPGALPGAEITALEAPRVAAKFDLSLEVLPRADELEFTLEWCTALFSPATAARLTGAYQRLAGQVARNNAVLLADLDPYDSRERARVPSRPAPSEWAELRFVQQPFERIANAAPDRLALIAGGREWTYGQLDRHANRLAHLLRRVHGVGPESPVGICIDRTPELIVALLAVLKAGAAYVPLDPAYPAPRLQQMLDDCRPPVLLVRGQCPIPTAAPIVPVDLPAAAESSGDDQAPALAPDAAGLAYIMYTSGSTGRPKGVMLPHAALLNLLRWQSGGGGGRARRTIQYTSVSFDVSFQEIFATFSEGGTLVLIDHHQRRDPAALAAQIEAWSCDRLFLPFVALEQLAEAKESVRARLHSLRDVITAGERLQSTPAIRELFGALPGCRLHNHYGPTETHVATSHPLPPSPSAWPDLPPIGEPVAGVVAYVCDRLLRLQPVGMIGELYLGGDQVARGYWTQPAATAERFVCDPFSGRPGTRMYRTGDLARLLPDGQLHFVGRSDAQVKIRGYRVEPAEVEAALGALPGVTGAAVVAQGEGAGRCLGAYYTGTPDLADVKSALRQTLPDHLVPSLWRKLETWPLTASGKLDRRALPRLSHETERIHVPPANETEGAICRLFGQILGASQVGTTDDFFAMGGHSLVAVRLMARVSEEFGIHLGVEALFQASTPQALAAVVRLAQRAQSVTATGATETKDWDLTL